MAAPILNSARIALPATINSAFEEFGALMQRTSRWIGTGLLLVAAAVPGFAATTEMFRNEKVIVSEEALAPGEQETVAGENPSVVVFLSGDSVEAKFADRTSKNAAVHRGDVINEAPGRRMVTNTGHTPLKLVRAEFLTEGSGETWGMTGLPPNYKVFFEDRHSRTYEIRIAPHAWEPQHTHHARVVVCLNGAQLEHVLPDGTKQPSTLKTDEVEWRQGQTHTGHNLGDTDLWVIAIEPK
jgi:hypothetical protein